MISLRCAVGTLTATLCLVTATTNAGDAIRVKDGNVRLAGSRPNGFAELGVEAYFAASRIADGEELWVSDGTSAGTALVKDIHPGPCPSSPAELTPMGGLIYFTADDGARGRELWRTDGTDAGTELVIDIHPVTGSDPHELTAIGALVYFTADDGVTERQLWVTNGTAAGTRLVREITATDHFAETPTQLTAVGSNLFFVAYENGFGEEVWVSDGTFDGTFRLRDIEPGVSSSWPQFLTERAGLVYFAADDGVNGDELWESDGTDIGTRLVADINPGSSSSRPSHIVELGGVLYFSASDGVGGKELWRSDGSAIGTTLVRDIEPGIVSSWPRDLTVAGSNIFFSASDTDGTELWVTNGTAVGTTQVLDNQPGPGSSAPSELNAVGSKLFFRVYAAGDPNTVDEPWVSDGNASGTFPLADIFPGPRGSTPRGFAEIAGTLFFAADDGAIGSELWLSDGSVGGTLAVARLGDGMTDHGHDPRFLPDLEYLWPPAPPIITSTGSEIFYATNDGWVGEELWRSDGSDTGTSLHVDARVGEDSAQIREMAFADPWVFFVPYDPAVGGYELWRTDGTDIVVDDIATGAGLQSTPTELTVIGDRMFFNADDGVLGRELWKWEAGASILVKDIDTAGTSDPSFLTALGGELLFVADHPSYGRELWRSDGTDAGTELVIDLEPGPADGSPGQLTRVGDIVYFFRRSVSELWRTDGTEAGTIWLESMGPDDSVSGLTAVGDLLFLWGTLGTGTGASVLFVTDGTPFSGRPLNIRPDGQEFPTELAALGDWLYFLADDGINGIELWRTSGTRPSTEMVLDIWPGSQSSRPQSLTAAGNLLFFNADDGVNGRELWQSDGTAAGTVLVSDVRPGACSSWPHRLYADGSLLYFFADDGPTGRELWRTGGAGSVRALLRTHVPDLSAPLAGLIPLDVVADRHDDPFVSGELDPDATVLLAPDKPLVLYEVDGVDVRLTKVAGRVRIEY